MSAYRIKPAPEIGPSAHVLIVVRNDGTETRTMIFDTEEECSELLKRIGALRRKRYFDAG